jgi:predicted PurR-regulated permease PerM
MNGIATGALVTLATIAAIALLYFGAPVFIPFFLGILIAYALSPVTDALTRVVRYRILSATIVVAGVLAILGTAAWAWSDDVAALWERVPEAAKTVSKSLKKVAQTPTSPVAEVKKAAAEIEAIAQTGKSTPPPAPAAAPSTFSFWNIVLQGGKAVLVALTQVVSVVFLVFFMLASGDMFKRKLVRMFGDTLTEKKITIVTIDEIELQIRRYLGVLLVSNLLVGFGTWIAFRVMGMNYPELWGFAAGIIHTAPYFGPAIIAVGSLLAAFLQFGNWPQAFMVSGLSVLVATLVGSVFATWLSARQTRMNTTATFVGLLFFGWIWGLWGILLAIPLLAIVKSICDRNEAWAHLSELLSSEDQPTKRLPPEAERNSTSSTPDAPTTP